MATSVENALTVCRELTQALSGTTTLEEIYSAAIQALADGLGVRRASILLFDPDRVMRFKAYRGLSDTYRAAVEGHTPWTPETTTAAPIIVPDVTREDSLRPYLSTITAERISGMTFIPLVSLGRVIGKFMLYFDAPHAPSEEEIQLAEIIGAQVAFAVQRTRTEERARRSEERLRFALDAASMGTWDWDLTTNAVQWSDNLARMHGLPEGSFDGTFASYEREIHPEDRERVLASVHRALSEGVAHDVEYRIVAPDGTIRWCEGKGRVEFEGGRPVHLTGVCMMVTRRKEAELARLSAAEEASRLKDEFLATLSHELRTPLNAILGWVQILKIGGVPQVRAEQAVEVIARNAKLQGQLIEDILDVSRIITGNLVLEPVSVLLPQVVESAATSFAPAAAAKGVNIVNLTPPHLPPLFGDPRRLHQVFTNILSNALKFTPEGGRVEITADVEAGMVVVQIKDSGIGIAPEFLPHIFDRFRQGDSSTTRQHGGLGLGLAIARHLVEKHGGDIKASSEGVGTGAAISVRLPIQLPVQVERLNSEPSPTTLFPDLEGLQLVVVDDHLDSRELVVSIFEGAGAVVTQCASAAEALRVVAAGHAQQLLITDIAMPEMDGYQLLERIRQRFPHLPAIAVSAYARPEDQSKAYAAGFFGYCVKPLEASTLIKLARNALASASKPYRPV